MLCIYLYIANKVPSANLQYKSDVFMEELKLRVYLQKNLSLTLHITKHCFDRMDRPQFFDRRRNKAFV
jgi:hypothetical protein